MNELRKLLNISLDPTTDGKNFIEIRCYCEFEGHGRASETWEEHWELTLPQIHAHWKSLVGWKRCSNPFLKQKFHGKTYNEVLEKAKQFLREKQNEKTC